MKNDLTISMKPLQDFIAKHHPVLFITITTLLLATAIFVLYDSTTATLNQTRETTNSIGAFDKKTIEKIKNLQSSNDTKSTLVFPTSRYNPFTE